MYAPGVFTSLLLAILSATSITALPISHTANTLARRSDALPNVDASTLLQGVDDGDGNGNGGNGNDDTNGENGNNNGGNLNGLLSDNTIIVRDVTSITSLVGTLDGDGNENGMNGNGDVNGENGHDNGMNGNGLLAGDAVAVRDVTSITSLVGTLDGNGNENGMNGNGVTNGEDGYDNGMNGNGLLAGDAVAVRDVTSLTSLTGVLSGNGNDGGMNANGDTNGENGDNNGMNGNGILAGNTLEVVPLST